MIPREATRLRRILYAAAFVRAAAVGLVAVTIGLYCARLGLSAARIGAIVSAALWGGALATLLTLLAGARYSPRTMLVLLAALPALGGVAFISTESFPLLLGSAFVGMFGVHGRDRGAIPILEQALLPTTVQDAGRTRVFAWYNVLLDAGYAAGGFAAALPSALEAWTRLGPVDSMRATLGVFCALNAAAAILYSRLPHALPDARSVRLRELSPASRPIVAKISLLFLVDAFGGGFIGSALLAYFFAERFGVSPAALAALFGVGRLLSAVSHLGAAWLARRIGLVNTMVFTHIPSSLLLFTIVASSDFGLAAFLFLLREGLNEMDVPTRQSYVMAVVRPDERLAAAGITSLVRSGGWAAAPILAGVMMQVGGLGLPLLAAGTLKIAYDLLLWREFRRVVPPEERAVTQAP
ncbi:MAG TPA: MFS transporter [Usitatibacter sp.]|nr:MFS transporter [Usitatibacter sp.]